MDREYPGREVQRLGGLDTVQAPGDELVASRGAGLGGDGSRAAQRRTRRLASGSRTTGTTVAGKAGVSPRIPVYVPYLNYYAQIGSTIGVSYKVFDGSKQVAVGQANASLAGDQSVTFTANFKPVKRHTYRVTATLVEQNGHVENRTATVTTA